MSEVNHDVTRAYQIMVALKDIQSINNSMSYPVFQNQDCASLHHLLDVVKKRHTKESRRWLLFMVWSPKVHIDEIDHQGLPILVDCFLTKVAAENSMRGKLNRDNFFTIIYDDYVDFDYRHITQEEME